MTYPDDVIESARVTPQDQTIGEAVGVNRIKDDERRPGWIHLTNLGWVIYADNSKDRQHHGYVPNAAQARVTRQVDGYQTTLSFPEHNITVTGSTYEIDSFIKLLDDLRTPKPKPPRLTL